MQCTQLLLLLHSPSPFPHSFLTACGGLISQELEGSAKMEECNLLAKLGPPLELWTLYFIQQSGCACSSSSLPPFILGACTAPTQYLFRRLVQKQKGFSQELLIGQRAVVSASHSRPRQTVLQRFCPLDWRSQQWNCSSMTTHVNHVLCMALFESMNSEALCAFVLRWSLEWTCSLSNVNTSQNLHLFIFYTSLILIRVAVIVREASPPRTGLQIHSNWESITSLTCLVLSLFLFFCFSNKLERLPFLNQMRKMGKKMV